MQAKILEDRSMSDSTQEKVIEDFKEANKRVREVGDLKDKNRVLEQQEHVLKLKRNYQTYRNLSRMSEISLKSVHVWCTQPIKKTHKATSVTNLRKKEYEDFLIQDTISFEHPCKKYSGKRFLRDTLEETRKKYLQQTEYHRNVIISMTAMKMYRPSYILLCNKTPLDQCLCDKCENFEQLLKTLQEIWVKEVPANRYVAVNRVVCDHRFTQFGSNFTFPF